MALGTAPDLIVRLLADSLTKLQGLPHLSSKSVSRLSAEPAFQEKVLFAQGMERAAPSGESPEVFAQFLQRDRALYDRIKAEGKLKIE
jgi:hypothetical protein